MNKTKIPSHWRRCKLHTVAQIQTGLSKSSNRKIGQPVRLPYLRVANVQDGYLDLSEIEEMEVSQDRVERYLLKHGDILLTEGGDEDKLGRGTIWEDQIAPCIHQNHIFVVRVDRNVLDPYFFDYLTSSPYGKSYFLKSAKRTTNLASINKSQLSQFPVLLPPLPEQRRIAEILSTWDEAIALTEQIIAALELRKKGLMQRLLSQEAREGWEKSELSQIIEIILSSVDKKSSPTEIPVRLCNYMDVFYNSYITDSLPFMEATAKQREIDKCQLFPNDVIVTKDSETPEDIAQAAVVVEQLTNVICGYHLAILRPEAEIINGRFLRELIMMPDIHYQFVRKANGATRFGLTTDSLKSIKVAYPSMDEQLQIVDVLQASDHHVALLEQYTEALKQQKKGLMQRLLTGQVRVSV